jgi:hypothetical protein
MSAPFSILAAPVSQIQDFHGLLPKVVEKFTSESAIVFLTKPGQP